MAITKTQKKELSIIQNHIYEARLDLDAFREKFILDYMKEGLIDDCIHWGDCYGNNMPFAHRISHENQNLLQKRIYNELLNSTNQLLLIRLHVLGDFFNVKYVKFWSIMLNTFKNIAIYGYTANNINSKIELSRDIAKEIIKLNYSKHSHIRFSNDLNNPFSANSYDIVKPVKGESILCPVQENKTANCGTCGLCWNQKTQSIIFKTH